jgi:hypothetical protein
LGGVHHRGLVKFVGFDAFKAARPIALILGGGGVGGGAEVVEGGAADDGMGFLWQLANDGGAVVFEDSGFFGGDRGQGVAKAFGVVEANRSNDANQGFVGDVPPRPTSITAISTRRWAK